MVTWPAACKGKNSNAGAMANASLKELGKILPNNFIINAKVSSNRCHVAGSHTIAAHKSNRLRRGAGNDNQNRILIHQKNTLYPPHPRSGRHAENGATWHHGCVIESGARIGLWALIAPPKPTQTHPNHKNKDMAGAGHSAILDSSPWDDCP
ncbi:MAG: hypothetical protein WAL75_26765 [Terracidiphilus sp.]